MAEQDPPTHSWLMERRYLSLVIVLAFVILSATTLFICYRYYTINTEQTLKEDRSAANLLSLVLDEHLKKLVSVMESYVQRPLLLEAVRNKNAEKAMVHLINLKNSNPDVDILIITDRQGTLWAAYPERPESLGRNFAYRDWYKGVSREWKSSISDVVLRVVGEKDLAVQISVPVVNEKGLVIGILTNTQRTLGMSYLFKPVLLDPGAFITITDRQGQIVSSSRQNVEKELRPYPFHREIIKAMAAKNNTFTVNDPERGGKKRYISFAPIVRSGWTVSVERAKRSIFMSGLGYYIQVTAIAFLLFLIIVLFIAYSRKQLMAREIQEQLRAGITLRQSEESERETRDYLDKLIGCANAPIIVWDPQFIITRFNHAFEDLTGLKVQEVLGKEIDLIFPESRREECLGNIRQTTGGKRLEAIEMPILHRNGSVRTILWNSATIYSPDGKTVVATIAQGQDITERKQMEQTLQESEAQLRAILNATPFPIALVDTQDSNIDFWSSSALTLFGHIAPTAPDWYQMAYPDPDYQREVIKRWKPFLEIARESRQPVNTGEYRVTCSDDLIRICELYATFLQDRLIVTFNDITERKQVELALWESRQQFQGLVETLYDLIWEVSPEGHYTYISPRVKDILGYEPEEIIGKKPFEMMPAEEGQRVSEIFASLRAQQKPIIALENINHHKDGHPVIMETSALPFYDSKGNFKGYRGTDRDITKRKQAEEARRESEEKYHSILENIDELYFELDLKGNITFFNDSVCSISGYAPSEAMGMNYRQYTSPETAKQVKALFGNIYLSGENSSISDFDFIDKDNSIHTLELSVKLLKNPAGEAVGFRCIGRDITDRKRTEAEKRRTEERYRTLFSRASDGIFIMTIEGKIVEVNEAFARMHGYSVEEMLQMNLKDFDTPQASQMALERMRRLLAGESLTFEVEHYHKDGHVFPLEVSASMISSREESYIQCFHRDITERKQAGEALEASEQKYRLLAENSVAAIWTANFAGGFTYVSSVIEKLLGYTVDEVMEIQMPGIVVKEDYENLMMILSAELAKPKEERLLSYSEQIRCKRKDGNVLDTEINVAWLKDNQGNIIGLQGNTSDITERKKAEEEKAKLGTQLQQAQKMESVGRLAGGVAHDFNNMLGLILGHAEMALDNVDPALPIHADLREIIKAAERSADLTRQLLAFARQQTVQPKVLDLNETVGNMLKMLQRLIGEDIELKWQSTADLWPIRMDPTQIDQIMANLCINARDAISDTGKITIETGNTSLDEAYCNDHTDFVRGEYVKLIVSDNGCGMDKETIEKIFEPFFTTKGVGKGTGLGLATVFGIVKQNNGFISVYSEPGQGTTFTLYLPRYVGKVEPVQPEVTQRTALRGKECILLVEDEPDILNLTTMLLERQGYTVLAANTPRKAISLAGEHVGEIHLLMTDVVMPEMNGRDLAKKMLDLYPHLKRLFTSGYTADVIAHHGVLDEGVHFIQKPFSIKALAAQVREVLDQK
jgi:two-component system cell cycle sensor histidine kinase/response regulator CckA